MELKIIHDLIGTTKGLTTRTHLFGDGEDDDATLTFGHDGCNFVYMAVPDHHQDPETGYENFCGETVFETAEEVLRVMELHKPFEEWSEIDDYRVNQCDLIMR